MKSLVNNTLMELCVLLGSLRRELAFSTTAPSDPTHRYLTSLRDRIETEAVGIVANLSRDLKDALPVAMQSYSRKVLKALPETDDAAVVDDASYMNFLQWAQAEDFKLAGARGLRLGAALEKVLPLAKADPEIEEVVFGDLARRGVLMNGRDPCWAESTRIWNVGEIDQILRLLEVHITQFPKEMSEALHRRADSNDAWGAEILFVAGARPQEGRALIAQDAACLPGAFLDRAKSNHGLMAALHGPSPAELIASFRRNSTPF